MHAFWNSVAVPAAHARLSACFFSHLLPLIQRRRGRMGSEVTWNNHNLPDKPFVWLDSSYKYQIFHFLDNEEATMEQ